MRRLLNLALLVCVSIPLSAQSDARVTVAVASLFHSRRFMVETVSQQPLTVRADEREFAIGQNSTQQVSVTISGGDRIRVQAPSATFYAKSVTFAGKSGGDFILSIPSRFRRQYRGDLRITLSKNELIPVVSMDRELAVASVVAAEAPSSTPIEALKALAVAARSYLVSGRPRHSDAQFCDTTHCQFLRNPPAATSPALRAATETRGLVLTFKGKPFPSMYSASCGGRTHTLAELGMAQRDYPYYVVECAFCRRHPDKWVSRVAEAEAVVAGKGESERVALARKLGWNVVPSNNFESRTTTEGVELLGVGHGHGLGLCERGAAAMAREGSDFRAILNHYYPNTVVDSATR